MMKIYSIKKVAEFLNIKESTLYSWVSTNKIPSYKINGLIRFDMDEIETWIKESKINQKTPLIISSKTKQKQEVDSIINMVIEDEK